MGNKRNGQAAIESFCGTTAGSLRGQAAIDSTASSAGNLRGQAAIEVMSYGALFLLVFVAITAAVFQLQSQELARAEFAYAQQAAYAFADHIQTAFIAGDGFWERVPVQPKLLGKDYKIVISRPSGSSAALVETGFVYVQWRSAYGNMSASAPTVTTKYAPSIGLGIDTNTQNFVEISPSELAEGSVNITNLQGTIVFG